MAKCKLAVALERADRKYQPGDTVNGWVHVDAQEAATCKEFTISQVWKTHGKGNTKLEEVSRREVGGQVWAAGRRYEYPFSFTAPSRPLSYHGEILNIDHYIKAEADIPWAVDPKVLTDYLLLPGPGSRRLYEDKGPNPCAPVPKREASGLVAGIFIVLFLALGVVVLTAFWWLFAILGIIFGVKKYMDYLARERLGEVTVELDRASAAPGERVEVRVSFTPRRVSEFNSITATVVARETCTSGSGTNTSTYHHDVYKREFRLARALRLRARVPADFRETITLPGLPAYSVDIPDNKLAWEVRVHLDVRSCPDVKRTLPLVVVPADVACPEKEPVPAAG